MKSCSTRSVRRGHWHLLPTAAAVALIATSANAATTQTTESIFTSDTFLKGGQPNQNFGTETVLRVRGSGHNRALVAIDPTSLDAAAAGRSVLAAELVLTISGNGDNWGDGREIAAHRMTTPWTELGATWNCPDDPNPLNGNPDGCAEWDMSVSSQWPFFATPSATTTITSGQRGDLVLDVSGDIALMRAGAAANLGWLLKKIEEGQNGRIEFGSRESATPPVLRLTVVDTGNTAPVAAGADFTTPESSTLVDVLPASDAEGAPLVVEIVTPPSTGTLTLDDPLAGAFTYTPPQTFNGLVWFEYRVFDGAAYSAVATATIEVTPIEPNRVSLATVGDTYLKSGQANKNQGTETAIRLQASGNNRALVQFDAQAIADAVGSGELVGATLRLKISDNGDNWGDGRAIAAHRLNAAWTELGATWNCTDDPNPLNGNTDGCVEWDMSSEAAWPFEAQPTGTTTITSGMAGTVTLDVGADVAAFLAGQIGHHGWLLKKVEEGQNGRIEFHSREGVVAPELELIVATGEAPPANQPPVAFDVVAATTEDEPVSGMLLASDPDGDPLTYGLVTASTDGLVFIGELSGDFTFTPVTGFTGTTFFWYQVSDGTALSNVATVHIDVSPGSSNEPPVVADLALTTTEVTPISAQLVASDGDGDPITFVVDGPGPDGTFALDVQTGEFTYSPRPGFYGSTGFSVRASDGTDWSLPAFVAIEVELAGNVILPPDPALVAPEIDRTVPMDFFAAFSFLFDGADPIQYEAQATAFTRERIALARGQVITRDGDPLAGVRVDVRGQPEVGYTYSRDDGAYDIAVQGGEALTLEFSKPGFVPAVRTFDAHWREAAVLDAVAMVPRSHTATIVDLADIPGPYLVVTGETQNDAAGTRTARLFVPSGNQAWLLFADTASQPIEQLTVRLTELTVGPGGPAAMPAELPRQSAYTYAIDYAVDEAEAAGADAVLFSDWLFSYNENIENIPVGSVVPAGFFNRVRNVWVPDFNGRVVKVLGVDGQGRAELDVDGSGLPATAGVLAQLRLGDDERAFVAATYVPGTELWRVPVGHFTLADYNLAPDTDGEPRGKQRKKKRRRGNCGVMCCPNGASTIVCDTATFGETVALVGAPFVLNYWSDMAPGYRGLNQLDIDTMAGPDEAGDSFLGAQVRITIAGKDAVFAIDADGNPGELQYTWDGKDAYGRTAPGLHKATIQFKHQYKVKRRLVPSQRTERFPAVPFLPAALDGNAFRDAAAEAAFLQTLPEGQAVVGSDDDRQTGYWLHNVYDTVGTFDATALGLGGWTLAPLHVYNWETQHLIRGDGGMEQAGSYVAAPDVLDVIEGNLASSYVAAVPLADGDLYGLKANGLLYRVQRDGESSLIANYAGTHLSLAVAPDGRVYASSIARDEIVRLEADGSDTTIAGDHGAGYNGEYLPAIDAQLYDPRGLAFGPDGALYVADSGNHRVRRIGTDNQIYTVAGNGSPGGALGDGGPATQASLNQPSEVLLAPNGDLYIADQGHKLVRRIDMASGRIETVAGGGSPPDGLGDGLAATDAVLDQPKSLALGADGTLYIGDGTQRIRAISAAGIITTVVGGGGAGSGAEGSSLASIVFPSANDLWVDGDGDLCWSTGGAGGGLYCRQSPWPGFSEGEIAVPDAGSSEVFVFDETGRHQRTVDARTGVLHWQFFYDAAGLVTAVVDRNGQATTILRDGEGLATAIVGPFGQQTDLGYDADGMLALIANPANETYAFQYDDRGLLTQMTNPRGHVSTVAYDDDGNLVADVDQAGARIELSMADGYDDREVVKTSPEGRAASYRTEWDKDGRVTAQRRTFPTGLQGVVTYDHTQSEVRTDLPDGTVETRVQSLDPRFGLAADLVDRTVRTPGGLERTESHTRDATLADADEPFSLLNETATRTVNGRAWTTDYDATTRTRTSLTPEGREAVAVLDERGRVVERRIGDLAPVFFTYDTAGSLIEVRQGEAPNARTTTLTYDAQQRLAAITDPLGRTTSFTYDDANRVLSRTLPDGEVVTFGYDEIGNLTALAPPDRPDHTFAYTPVQLEAEYDPPAAGLPEDRTTTAYNLDRDMTLLVRPDGLQIEYGYDGAGRLNAITAPSDTITYSYDPATGQLAQILHSAGVDLSFTWDGQLRTSVTWSGDVAGTVAHSYDDSFRRTAQTVNGAHAASFAYDNDDLLVAAGDLTIVRDTETGLIDATALEQTADARAYNEFGELIAYAADVDATPLYEATYSRDDLGRIISKTETIGGSTTTYDYVYDLRGRLAQVLVDGSLDTTYTYDPNGNRTSYDDGVSVTTATYDDQDRLLSYGANTYTTTANGELRTKTTPAGTTTYDYDVFGNLRQAVLPDGTTIDYLVDGQHRRVGRQVDGTTTHQWLYQDQLNPVAELDAAGNVRSRFVYGTRFHVPDTMIRDGVTYRLVSDHLGSVRLVVNAATGDIAQRLDYDAWGRVLMDTNPGFQPFGFAGGLYDHQTGLVRFGARDYDSEVGRWTARDPLRIGVVGTNLYEYNLNDPQNFNDPWGSRPQPNGNWDPGFSPQDDKCSGAAGIANSSKCLKKCCQSHDNCYTQYGCNQSSWITTIGNALSGVEIDAPCVTCNKDVVGCFADTASGESKCGCN